MKRLLPLLGCVIVAACQDSTEPNPTEVRSNLSVQSNTQAAEEVVPGRVLARFADGASPGDVAGPYGLTVAGRGYANAFVILRGAVGSERALAARLDADSRVVYAEPDYRRRFEAIDSRLWAFRNPGGLTITFTRGQTRGQVVGSYFSLLDADMDNVEAFAANGADVVISSLDTGVQLNHPEFPAGTLIVGQDWYSGDNDPSDENGHGTHTTGTMAGQTVGVAGVSGAGPHVKVLVQRVCGPQFCDTSAIASAIRAAADMTGMVAMNLSLSGSSESSAEAEAIQYATDRGVLVIASAGNGGTGTVGCPACDPNAISVAASNWQDAHSYYTNWGNGLDLIAPGGELYSNTTEEAGIYSAYLGGGYAYLQGTSMAAPQVTGAAAIVASKTGARGAALRSLLQNSADDLGPGGYDTDFGHGRLNTYRAVTGTTPPGEPGGGGTTLTAAFTFSCRGGATCTFDGGNSTAATAYSWNFGDGSTATGVSATHTFAAGTFTVTLTVGDGGSTASTSQTVNCVVKGPKIRCG